jgi:dTDP-4-amino-4,6-dideoxygalactose transaminase
VSGDQIPVFDLRISDDDVEAVTDTLRSGWLTMGPRTQEFEEAFAERLGAEHVVALANCTAALHVALIASGVGPGDEVIVPPLTFVATAAAVRYAGATPVFADIVGNGDLGISVDSVAAAITERTKAVIPVHFAGYPIDIEALGDLCSKRGIALIEDAAHTPDIAVGERKLGTFGDSGCFSFFSNKVLAVGEGGALATNSAEIAARVRSLRSHAMTSGTWDRHRGHAETYDVVELGFNYRIDETRAALLLSRMRALGDDLDRRRELVAGYRELLAEVDGVEVAYREFDLSASSGYLMCVLLEEPERRPDLRVALRERHGVQTTVFPAVHTLSAYSDYVRDPLPNSDAAGLAHVVLPLFPALEAHLQERVVEALVTELARG